MRNLKKILALALVFAMAFTFTAGAADFTDAAEINAKYADDVNMLVELGVIAGYPDGSFGPQKNITRAEFAKMAYTLKYGSDANGDLFAAQKSAFTDVEGNANVAWAKGYINYCANQKIVSGVGNNKFNPQGNITVAEAAKMILVILGCDPAKEGFTGANWAANVTSKAIDLGVFDGWTGDPMSLATRELVAKLMKNAVFAPVYTYSTITGEGSQMNVFQNEENITLGEKTMGLLCETGIVVANENYALTTGAEGEDLWVEVDEDDDGDVDYINGVVPAATGVDSDESQIYYTYKTTAGVEVANLLTIPVALDDALLGAEVTVFFKADEYSDRAYRNVELFGDVMVTSETVIYDVPAILVDAYPNGQSKSTAQIAPYLAFEYEGKEVQVKAPAGTAKVAKNADFQDMPEIATAFGAISYVCDADLNGANGDAGTIANGPAYDAAFFAEMGTPVLSSYRFVSVDGGKSYSYIFKMVNDDNTNIKYGAVSSYSEAKGTITIEGVRFFLDEVNIIGDVDADSMVVYYYENGIVNIEAVEEVTGEVEALNDDGSAVINGLAYYLWANTEIDTAATTLTGYYTENPAALEEGTTYYVYNGIVLDLEATETVSVTADYALIVGSSYDEKTDVAYVTLAFADNTQSTYEIGKLNVENRREPYHEDNDLAADFAFNTYFGMLVKYKVMDNGKIDLSANDFKKIVGAQQDSDGIYAGNTITYAASHWAHSVEANTTAYEGVLDINGSKMYAANNDAVIFVIYGQPQHEAKLDGSGAFEDYKINRDGYEPIKAVAYKFVDKRDQDLGTIADLTANGAISDVTAYSYALNSANSASRGIVAAAMTIDMNDDSGLAGDTDDLAYIVKAVRKYNVAAQDYYLQMTLIGDDGLFVANTIDGVPGAGETTSRDFSGDLGEVLPGDTSEAADFIAGFVTYTLNADGEIATMDKSVDVANAVVFNNAVAAEGLYLVNVVSERNGGIFFIDADAEYDDADAVKAAPQSMIKYAEDGYKVVTIDADEYAGEVVIKVPSKETNLDANVGNAVIQVNDEGEIARVFSFVEGAAIADLNV